MAWTGASWALEWRFQSFLKQTKIICFRHVLVQMAAAPFVHLTGLNCLYIKNCSARSFDLVSLLDQKCFLDVFKGVSLTGSLLGAFVWFALFLNSCIKYTLPVKGKVLICNFHVCSLSRSACGCLSEALVCAWFQWHCFCQVVLRTGTWQNQWLS